MRKTMMTAAAVALTCAGSLALARVADLQPLVDAIEQRHQACMDAAQSNVDYKECTFRSYEEANQLLATRLEAHRTRLRTAGNEYATETLRRLDASQAAWRQHRDAQCALEGTEMLGGTGETLVIGSCYYQMAKDRVIELERILVDIGN